MVGSVRSVGSHTILRSYAILHNYTYDPTQFYIRSYHFCNPVTILNFLVRWDRKIMRFYDPNRDFDNHALSTLSSSFVLLSLLLTNK